jgi:uncharacterized protein YdhG (YjbR/CyaY superfamily)
VRSDAATVDAYLAAVPEDRRDRRWLIRRLCLVHLPDHGEAMQWGMPVYRRSGRAEFAWASQNRYISVYVMKPGAVAANAERLAGLDMGKGCLRLKPLAAVDSDLIGALLDATAASPDEPC